MWPDVKIACWLLVICHRYPVLDLSSTDGARLLSTYQNPENSCETPSHTNGITFTVKASAIRVVHLINIFPYL